MAHYRRPSTTSSGPHVRELETKELYREAFDVACHAVQLDNSGVHAEAREAYIDAIQVYKWLKGLLYLTIGMVINTNGINSQ